MEGLYAVNTRSPNHPFVIMKLREDVPCRGSCQYITGIMCVGFNSSVLDTMHSLVM